MCDINPQDIQDIHNGVEFIVTFVLTLVAIFIIDLGLHVLRHLLKSKSLW